MARRRTSTDDDILHLALQVFWQHGYAATSIQQLTEATGAKRSTIYRSFESKSGLFVAALDRYGDVLRATVNPEASPLEQLRQWFDGAISRSEDPDTPAGCMLINASADPASMDTDVRRAVTEHLSNVTQFFHYACVGLGRSNPKRDAAVLTGANFGVFMLSKQGAPHEHLRAVVDAAIHAITREEN